MLKESELLHFLELIAHKIKNPLHSMGLNLEATKIKVTQLPTTKSESLLKHVRILEIEGERLNRIIQTAIEYLRPGCQDKSRIRLNRFLSAIRLRMTPQTSEKEIDLQFEIGDNLPPLIANQNEIQNALVYLIQNSIESISKHGKITVTAYAKNQSLIFEIQDNGSGIAKDEAKKVINFYYTTKKGHVGMGLPLARKLIAENGGKIRMHSKAGKGTLVIISFENKG